MKASRAQMKILRQQAALQVSLERIEGKVDHLTELLESAVPPPGYWDERSGDAKSEGPAATEQELAARLAEVAARAQEPMPDAEPVKAAGKKK